MSTSSMKLHTVFAVLLALRLGFQYEVTSQHLNTLYTPQDKNKKKSEIKAADILLPLP